MLGISTVARVSLIIVGLLFAASHAVAGSAKIVDDMDATALAMSEAFGEDRLDDFAGLLADLVGTPEQKASLQNTFGAFKGKKAELIDKVVDKSYGTSLRQIVYFLPYSDYNFLYLRFNFKRTGKGWIMANFWYKNETQEIFPPGLVESH
jgi:hypothetical protein